MPLISLRSPIKISLMVKVAKRKPLCNEGKPQKLALQDRGAVQKRRFFEFIPSRKKGCC